MNFLHRTPDLALAAAKILRAALNCAARVNAQALLEVAVAENKARLRARNALFMLDGAFDDRHKQQDVYDKVAAEPVEGLLSGYSAAILAYGQTGSGKTHTLYGPDNVLSAMFGIFKIGWPVFFSGLIQIAASMLTLWCATW